MAVLIAPTTSAVTSNPFTANENNVGLVANGLGAGESVKVQVYDDTVSAYVDVKIAGSVPQADVNNNLITIYQDAFTYRVVKSATATPVGVAIYQNLLKIGGYNNANQ